MTLLYFEGFEGCEAPGIYSLPQGWGGSNLDSGALWTAAPRTGNGMLTVTGAGKNARLTIAASAKITVGFALYAHPLTGNVYDDLTRIVLFYGDAGATQHLSLNTNSAGALTLRRGTSSGTIIATSTLASLPVVDRWAYIEVQATIADSGGRCIVKVDGTTWIDFTGDTKNAGTATTIDTLQFGESGAYTYYDDLYVCDGVDATAVTGRTDNDFLGDVKVQPLLPNGNGAESDWVGSDGNSTDNYALVDETPKNTTDYLAASVSGDRDLWELTNLTGSPPVVYGVAVDYWCQKSDAGASSIVPVYRLSGGTEAEETAQALSTSWGILRAQRNVKPGGGAWSVSDVNGLQVGVEVA